MMNKTEDSHRKVLFGAPAFKKNTQAYHEHVRTQSYWTESLREEDERRGPMKDTLK